MFCSDVLCQKAFEFESLTSPYDTVKASIHIVRLIAVTGSRHGDKEVVLVSAQVKRTVERN